MTSTPLRVSMLLMAGVLGGLAAPAAEAADSPETQKLENAWIAIQWPKQGKPGEAVTLAVVIPAGVVPEDTSLMVGMHWFGANGQRNVTPHSTGPFAVKAGERTELEIKVNLFNTAAQYWALPIWLSSDGKWRGGNPHAMEIHIGRKGEGQAGPPTAARPIQLVVEPAGGVWVFPENDIPRFDVRRPSFPPTRLSGTIKEVDGAWSRTIEQPWPAEAARVSVALDDVPRRGLYELKLSAQGADANVNARLETRFAVVFDPPPPDEASRWGMFSIYGLSAKATARGTRLAGASWVRQNIWPWRYLKNENITIVSEDPPEVQVDIALLKSEVQAFLDEGLFVMVEFSGMPHLLTSRPELTTGGGVDGPPWSRYPPRDWGLWEALVETVVKELPGVQAWEIWNEPGARNFWNGTTEEFAEMVKRTSQAIRRANPQALVVASGFTNPLDHVTVPRLLELGVDPHVDIYSFHAPYDFARKQLAGLPSAAAKPMWHTEAHTLANQNALRYERLFHFLFHGKVAWMERYPVLFDRKGPTRWACGYATAVNMLGNARIVSEQRFDTGDWTILAKEPDAQGRVEHVAVWRSFTDLLEPGRLRFRATPLSPEQPIRVRDLMGRDIHVQHETGEFEMPFAGHVFLAGAAHLEVVEAVPPSEPELPEQYHFRAVDTGRHSPGWRQFKKGEGISPVNASGDWMFYSGDAPAWVEVDVDVPRAGVYELFYLGISTTHIDRSHGTGRWNSPFRWSLGGVNGAVEGMTEVMVARSTSAELVRGQRLNTEQMRFRGNGNTYELLGRVPLTAGRHTFRLELSAPRDVPNKIYTSMFEGIVLRPMKDDMK